MTNLKQQTANAALEYLAAVVQKDWILGIGTGSTVNHLIDDLSKLKGQFEAVVSSSKASSQRLASHGIPIIDLNQVSNLLPIYIDGADEVNPKLQLIKGGGGALTREKIIAAASEHFVCIADQSKSVEVLGRFPLPLEVVPMARSYVAQQLRQLGGQAEWRKNFITDNGNIILDTHGLKITDPEQLEQTLNNIAGVVTVGLFALRPADILLLGTEQGVQEIRI